MPRIVYLATTHPHSAARLTYRYLSGRPLSGRRITNATFLRAADHAYDPHERRGRWHFRPGWQRAAWRVGIPLSTAITATADVMAPLATHLAGGTAIAGGAAYGSRQAWRAHRQRAHQRRYIRPLAAAIARLLDLPAITPAAQIVHVPLEFLHPDYSRDRHTTDSSPDGADRLPHGTVVIRLPADMPDLPDLQRAVVRTTLAKLGLDATDTDVKFRMVGPTPTVTLRRAPQPPERVKFADIRELIDTTTSGAPLLGIASRGRAVTVDLDSDSPHIAVSCATGGGKSVLLRSMIAQFLHGGAQVYVLDGKRFSQSWAKDLPGVTYARTGAEIHDVLTGLEAELHHRNDLISAVDAELEDTVDVGPRIVVVFEEQNVGMKLLKSHWEKTRVSGQPKRSPALDALDTILYAGRAARVHVVTVAQLFTVQTAGGDPAARENYSTRILARATKNAWLMLAPEAGPTFPRQSRHRGRMHVVLGGDVIEIQTPIMTIAEARAWASSGTVHVPVEWTGTPTSEQAQRRGHPETGTSEPPRYTLAEAARQPWCPLKYEALKKASRRARARGEWPIGVVDGQRERWTEAELRIALGLDPEPATPATPATPAARPDLCAGT